MIAEDDDADDDDDELFFFVFRDPTRVRPPAKKEHSLLKDRIHGYLIP